MIRTLQYRTIVIASKTKRKGVRYSRFVVNVAEKVAARDCARTSPRSVRILCTSPITESAIKIRH